MGTLPLSIHGNALFLLGAMLAVIVAGSKRISPVVFFQAAAIALMVMGVFAAASTQCLEYSCDVKYVGAYRFVLDMFALSALLIAIRMLIVNASGKLLWALTGVLGIAIKISELFLANTCPILR